MARSMTGSVEVLVARIASGRTTRSSSSKSSRLTDISSTTDSMTRSQSARSSRCVVGRDARAQPSAAARVRSALSTSRASDALERRPAASAALAPGAAAHDDRRPGAAQTSRDAAGHDSRPDDADGCESHRGTLLGGAKGLRARLGRWSARRSSRARSPCARRDRRVRPGARARRDVVVVPTAAAFTGAAPRRPSPWPTRSSDVDARVEAIMVTDRASAARALLRPAVGDGRRRGAGRRVGAARALGRGATRPVGDGDRAARDLVVAVGSVASVLGDVMVDPRGGAPTIGLGYRTGPVVTVPAAPAQLARTRGLLERARDPRRGRAPRARVRGRGRATGRVVRATSSVTRGGRRPRSRRRDSVIVTDSMTTRSLGVPERRADASIAATTSRPATDLAEQRVERRQRARRRAPR